MKKAVFKPLDDYEKNLMRSIEAGEWDSVSDQKKMIKLIKETAKQTLEKNRPPVRKAISLKIPINDLNGIKASAQKQGLPYPTLIGSIIHQYVNKRA